LDDFIDLQEIIIHMNKILLIKPYWPYPYGKGEHTYNRIWPPLALANCAAILEREGHCVKILDAHALRIKPNRITKHLDGYDKIFITSSSLDRWQCPNIDLTPFWETVRQIKSITDEIYILGYHGTVDPQTILTQSGAKAIIRGAPEYAVSEICQDKSFSNIAGLSWLEDGQIRSNPDRESLDLSQLPVPAFHLLDRRKYFYELLGKDFALFELGRGCNFACKFCNKIMYGPRLRVKSKEQVFEELRVAIDEQGFKTGYFMDLELLHYKNLVSDVCDYLISKDYDFQWCCQTRADSLDPDILKKMKTAGCRLIHIGVESGIQKFLDLSGKNTTEEKLIRGFRMCEEIGIKTLAFCMFGFNGETPADRKGIFEFVKKLNPNFVSFHKVYPYLKSDMYLSNLQKNKAIDRYIGRSFLKYYLRVSYLKKENILTILKGFKLYLGRLVTLS